MLKTKIHPRRRHEGPEEEYRYSSTLSLTPALDGGGRSMARTGGFTPRKDPVPTYRRLGKLVSTAAENPVPPVFDPLTFQSVASRYSDCAIKGHGKELER